MDKRTILGVVVSLSLLGLPIPVNAQRPWVQPIESPIVHPDRTVTFYFKAPNAKRVDLSAELIKDPQHLQRDTSGIWSITGKQSLFAGFTNMDKFAWICSYSAYLTNEVCDEYFADLFAHPEATNKQLKLLWLGVGKEDFLYKQAVTFIDLLKEEKIEQKNLIASGGHTWMNARHYLAETGQLFFR